MLSIDTPIGLDYPYVTTLLPNDTIEIHSIETQSIIQVISAPPTSRPTSPFGRGKSSDRASLAASLSGYMVPSAQRSDKMRKTPVPLLRRSESIATSNP